METRSNVKLSFAGETKTLAEWAIQLGLQAQTIYKRMEKYGWSIEKALTTPVAQRIRRSKNDRRFRK